MVNHLYDIRHKNLYIMKVFMAKIYFDYTVNIHLKLGRGNFKLKCISIKFAKPNLSQICISEIFQT